VEAAAAFAAQFKDSLFVSIEQAVQLMDSRFLHIIIDYDVHPHDFERFKELALKELHFVDDDEESFCKSQDKYYNDEKGKKEIQKMPAKNMLQLPTFGVMTEGEWAEFYGDDEFSNSVVAALMDKGWTDELSIARGFYGFLDEGTSLLDSEEAEVVCAKVLPLLVKFRQLNVQLDDFDAFNGLLAETPAKSPLPPPADQSARETLKQLDKLPVSDLRVKEIELTVFNKFDGAILDNVTGLPYAVSAQMRDQDVAFSDIAAGIQSLLIAVVNGVNEIIGQERFTLNPGAFPKEPNRQYQKQSASPQQARSAPPQQRPATPPQQQQRPPQARPTAPHAAPQRPQAPQQGGYQQGRQAAENRKSKKQIAPLLMTVDPSQAQIWDYDQAEQARNDAMNKLAEGQALIEVYGIKRLFTKQGKSGLSFTDHTGKVELFAEFDNSTHGDPKALFQNPFWKLDEGAYQGNGQVTINSLMHYLWNMQKGEIVFFPNPLFLAVKQNGNNMYIAKRLNDVSCWASYPFYAE